MARWLEGQTAFCHHVAGSNFSMLVTDRDSSTRRAGLSDDCKQLRREDKAAPGQGGGQENLLIFTFRAWVVRRGLVECSQFE